MKQYVTGVKNKLFNYFNQRLKLKKSTKEYFRTDCPYCGGYNTLAINVHRSEVKCFKCLVKQSPFKFILEIENLDTYNQVYSLLKVQEEFDQLEEVSIRRQRDESIKIELPEHFHSILNGSSFLGKIARNYVVNKRGFSLNDLALKGVGYCTDGPYMGYIIFPYYSKGELKYYQGRKFVETPGPKMKNPDEEEIGVGKSELFYNEDAIYIYNRIRLIESITNAITIGDTGIGSNGKVLGDQQLKKLYKAPFNELVIMYDDDAYKEGIELGMQLVHFKKVKVVKFPEGKDVNDLGRRKSLKLEKETPWQTYNDLLKIKMNLHRYDKEAEYPYNGRGFDASSHSSL